jgi:hypothetical protein
VATASVLGGYVLEEVIARLIQSSGYRLLVDKRQDPHELAANRSGDLLVRGRGGTHQVDVLGEFSIIPAFGSPLRVFVEAKARSSKTGIAVVRNAVGTISDVNQGWMTDYSKHRTRRDYRYALFSTGGFSLPAQNYALAHQISLIDLSGPEWADLRRAIHAAATSLAAIREPFRIRLLRDVMRSVLRTQPHSIAPLGPESDDGWAVADQIQPIVWELSVELDRLFTEGLLAFPAGHQVLLARPENFDDFFAVATRFPEHRVSLTFDERSRQDGVASTWVVRPLVPIDQTYDLRVTLPREVERRALAEAARIEQSLAAKGDLGGRMDVHWDPPDGAGPRIFRLTFAGEDLRRRRR